MLLTKLLPFCFLSSVFMSANAQYEVGKIQKIERLNGSIIEVPNADKLLDNPQIFNFKDIILGETTWEEFSQKIGTVDSLKRTYCRQTTDNKRITYTSIMNSVALIAVENNVKESNCDKIDQTAGVISPLLNETGQKVSSIYKYLGSPGKIEKDKLYWVRIYKPKPDVTSIVKIIITTKRNLIVSIQVTRTLSAE